MGNPQLVYKLPVLERDNMKHAASILGLEYINTSAVSYRMGQNDSWSAGREKRPQMAEP